MKESDLYLPVRDWLHARGWTVHVEVFDCDIVAVKDNVLRAVELKPTSSPALFRQLHDRAGSFDEVMAAVVSTPNIRGNEHLDGFECWGFGLLQIDPTTRKVKQRRKCQRQPYKWRKRRNYRMKKLAERHPALPHERGGVTSVEACEQRNIRDQILEMKSRTLTQKGTNHERRTGT